MFQQSDLKLLKKYCGAPLSSELDEYIWWEQDKLIKYVLLEGSDIVCDL